MPVNVEQSGNACGESRCPPQYNLNLCPGFFDRMCAPTPWERGQRPTMPAGPPTPEQLSKIAALSECTIATLLSGKLPGVASRYVRHLCWRFLHLWTPSQQGEAMRQANTFLYKPLSADEEMPLPIPSTTDEPLMPTAHSDQTFADEPLAPDEPGTTNAAKKRHACGKRKGESKPPPPLSLIPAGYRVVKLQPVEDCRLQREVTSTICNTKFKYGGAPIELLEWPGTAQSERIWLLIGKENGSHYYSQSSLSESPTAMAILEAADSKEDAYSRLPLLLTPSTLCEWQPGEMTCEVVDDEKDEDL